MLVIPDLVCWCIISELICGDESWGGRGGALVAACVCEGSRGGGWM